MTTSPFPDLRASCLSTSHHALVLTTSIQHMPSLERAHTRPPFHVARASATISLSGRETFLPCPVFEAGDCFTPELLRYLRRYCKPLLVWMLKHFLLAQYLIYALWLLIVGIQEKSHASVDRVLNLYNGRELACGWRRLAERFAAFYASDKAIQMTVVWIIRVTLNCLESLNTNWAIPVPPRRTAIERRPHLVTNSLSLRQLTHFPGSFGSHNDDFYKDLRAFAAILFVHLSPPSGSSTLS